MKKTYRIYAVLEQGTKQTRINLNSYDTHDEAQANLQAVIEAVEIAHFESVVIKCGITPFYTLTRKEYNDHQYASVSCLNEVIDGMEIIAGKTHTLMINDEDNHTLSLIYEGLHFEIID